MGLQQILLVVIGIIIVGVAVTIGIALFNNQAYNSNQQSVVSDLTNYSTLTIQYWKTPVSLGGCGGVRANLTKPRVTDYLSIEESNGYSRIDNGNGNGNGDGDGNGNGNGNENNTLGNDNGEYRVTQIAGTVVTIKGLGKHVKHGKKPLITATVDVVSSAVSMSVESGTEF